MLNKISVIHLKKKYNPNDEDNLYISFETFNEIARFIVLKIEQAEEYTSIKKTQCSYSVHR